MPIGVPRQLDHVPAVHPVAFVQELRIAFVPDQRQRLAVAFQHRLPHLRRDAVQTEPVGDPLRPVRSCHTLSHCA